MAALTTQTVSWVNGLSQPTYTAAAASDDCEAPTYGGQIFLIVKNTNASTRTITITAPGTNEYGGADPDPVYTVQATTGELIIPLHPLYANSSGRITITPSVTTNVSYAVVKLSKNA